MLPEDTSSGAVSTFATLPAAGFRSAALSSDGKRLVVAGTDEAYVYATVDKTLISSEQIGTQSWGVAVNPNGKSAYV